MREILCVFQDVEDPRRGNAKRHDLQEALMISLLSMLAGGRTCVGMEDYGCVHEPWLGGFLRLPNGIPSHDTFSRLFPDARPGRPVKGAVALGAGLGGPSRRGGGGGRQVERDPGAACAAGTGGRERAHRDGGRDARAARDGGGDRGEGERCVIEAGCSAVVVFTAGTHGLTSANNWPKRGRRGASRRRQYIGQAEVVGATLDVQRDWRTALVAPAPAPSEILTYLLQRRAVRPTPRRRAFIRLLAPFRQCRQIGSAGRRATPFPRR